ncbi:MAG: ATP-binding cassette domain-containing protein [Rickettsiales bacterium]|jgi:subfamily B ATP-binding cassette protein MsbA|nr:ATP-binding cassette domain-containing protein [Rickettsiales bacterium]
MEKAKNPKILRRIWREHTRKYIPQLVAAIVLTSLIAMSEAYAVSLLQPIFDKGFADQNSKMLRFLCAQITGVYFLKGGLYYAQTLIMSYITQKTIMSIRSQVFSHLLTLDMAFFNKNSSGQMLSKVVNETNSISQIAITFITTVFKDFITTIAMFGIMIFYSWRTFLFVVVIFPIGALLIKRASRKIKSVMTANTQQSADFMSKISESFQNIKIIKSYGMEHYEAEYLKGTLKTMFDTGIGITKVQSSMNPIIEGLSGIVISGIIIFGGWQVTQGTLTTGGFVTFLGAWVSVYKPLKSLVNFRVQFQMAMVAAVRVYELLDTKPEIADAPKAVELKKPKGNIEFKDVSFAYEAGKSVLKDINLSIPAGKTVALVGASGGGKSTIASLIPRFFDISAGSITLDGMDIRKIKQKSLRAAISLVSQDVILFDDTIRNNILYGRGENAKKEVSQAEIVRAAKMANADGFIMEAPQGYDTKIGERGVLLSGGQKQRISIARAIIKDAPILLLDEATSALDTESEAAVQAALDNLMKNRTTLVIAHRLSTIVNADKIYVIARGKVVESGTHKTLLAKKGEYAKLYNMQFKGGK